MATAAISYLSRGLAKVDWQWGTSATGPSNTLALGNYVDMEVQIFGPTGGTTNILLEGRLGPTLGWSTLESVSGLSLSLNDAEPSVMYVVRNHPYEIRARASTVTGGVSIAPRVHVLVRTGTYG